MTSMLGQRADRQRRAPAKAQMSRETFPGANVHSKPRNPRTAAQSH